MHPHEMMDEWTLRRHVGRLQQVAGVRRAVLEDGKGRGVRVADVSNGSGLAFTVLLDRGMDIGRASYRGVPLAYMTPVGHAHPAHYEPDGLRWLRNWHAGLLTGCGLSNVGLPQQPDASAVAGPMGLHGRLSNSPAEGCASREEFRDGVYTLAIEGTVREASMFGENLELRRTISTALGRNVISIRDTVTNRAFQPAPLMILYHVNIGFPMLDGHARLVAVEHEVTPRNADAEPGLSTWMEAQEPTPGYVEQCFYHELPADDAGFGRMRLENPGISLAVEVACGKETLPYFTQWKMMGEGAYVMGLEPANCHCEGQQAEREGGTLQELAPGERAEFAVDISVRELS
jgi:hypothetical protein